MGDSDKENRTRPLQVFTRLQRTLLRRLTDFVLENEESLRRAAEGAEGYGYTLHQLDELFLSRLNLVERTLAELQKSPPLGANRYRSLCFWTSRDRVEDEINSRLEKIPDARVLGVSVGPDATARRGADPQDPGRPGEDSTGADPAPARPGASSSEAGGGEGELLVTVLYYGPTPAPAEP
jgi:hypothetical protein